MLSIPLLRRHRPSPPAITPAWAAPYHALPQTLVPLALHIEPQDGVDWLYTLVHGAKTSIDMTMYELVDPVFSGALVDACQRGVKVRVILDGTLERRSNTPAYDQLAAAGPHCSVAWSNPQFQATHQKTLILDGTTAVVMTFNLTTRYYGSSRDFGLIDTDNSDVVDIEATFAKDFGSTTDKNYQPDAGHNLIWSPTTAQDDLLSLINGARQTLLVENEELGDAPIVTALENACKRGVHLSLAMTDTNTFYHTNFQALETAGCGVHIGADDADTLYIHAKAIVADAGTPDAIGYVGSINFSNASLNRNRELGLYIHDAALLRQIASTLTSDYNGFPAWNPAGTQLGTSPAGPTAPREIPSA